MSIDIYHGCAKIIHFAEGLQVIEMHVTVDEIIGPCQSYKPSIGRKPYMRGVSAVVDTPGRGVGENDVDGPPEEKASHQEPGKHPDDSEGHPQIGVLVLSIIVADGAGKAEHIDAAFFFYGEMISAKASSRFAGILHSPAALERYVTSIVIPRNRDERFVEHTCDVFEVFIGKVPRRKHKVDVGKTFADLGTVDE
jgi:hypothetical protein